MHLAVRVPAIADSRLVECLEASSDRALTLDRGTDRMIVTMAPPDVQSTLVADLTAQTFDEAVAASAVPVVVDVWTAWCGPCKTLAPIVEELANELAGQVTFYKLDAEAHPETAARYQVMSFPTLLVFERGELVQRLIGARGRRHLLEELSSWI